MRELLYVLRAPTSMHFLLISIWSAAERNILKIADIIFHAIRNVIYATPKEIENLGIFMKFILI